MRWHRFAARSQRPIGDPEPLSTRRQPHSGRFDVELQVLLQTQAMRVAGPRP
jgi:hypothetical protein